MHESFLKTKRGFGLRFNRFCLKNSVISVMAAHLALIEHEDQHITARLRQTLIQLAEAITTIVDQSENLKVPCTDNNPKKLKRMNDSQLIGYCRKIYDLLIEHPNAFIKHGIVVQVRDTLQRAIDVFNARVIFPEVQKKLTAHYKQLLEKLCLEMNTMLSGDINLFIGRLRLANPALVKEYKQIIKMVD